MAVDELTYTNDRTADGTGRTVYATHTVADGELYYLEDMKILIYNNSDATDSMFQEIIVKVTNSASGRMIWEWSAGDDADGSFSRNVGRYIGSGHTIEVIENSEDSEGGFVWSVHARRVL